MAAALSLTMGRLGALVGNLIFGYLIDLACIVPIVIFAAFLFRKFSANMFLRKERRARARACTCHVRVRGSVRICIYFFRNNLYISY